MSKLSTPLLIVLAIATVVGISGWRSASGKISTATAELTTTSNKLVEVTAKLAEQGAAAETLRVQLNLQKADLAAASNQITAANTQVDQHASRIRDLESEVSNRDAQIVAVNRSNAQLHARLGELQTQALALQTALETTRAQIFETSKKLDAAASALNEAEANKATLLAKLNDPSTLRSQLKSATAAPASSSVNPVDAKLLLTPDGTVKVVPPPAPAKVAPIFSEPPEEKINTPKIIIPY